MPRWIRSPLVALGMLVAAVLLMAWAGSPFSTQDTWGRFVWGVLFGALITGVSSIIERIMSAAERRHEILLPQKADAVVEILEAARASRNQWHAYRVTRLTMPSVDLLLSDAIPKLTEADGKLVGLGFRYRPILESADGAIRSFLRGIQQTPPPASTDDIERYQADLTAHFTALEHSLRDLLARPIA